MILNKKRHLAGVWMKVETVLTVLFYLGFFSRVKRGMNVWIRPVGSLISLYCLPNPRLNRLRVAFSQGLRLSLGLDRKTLPKPILLIPQPRPTPFVLVRIWPITTAGCYSSRPPVRKTYRPIPRIPGNGTSRPGGSRIHGSPQPVRCKILKPRK
jgi:hypothetical protein